MITDRIDPPELLKILGILNVSVATGTRIIHISGQTAVGVDGKVAGTTHLEQSRHTLRACEERSKQRAQQRWPARPGRPGRCLPSRPARGAYSARGVPSAARIRAGLPVRRSAAVRPSGGRLPVPAIAVPESRPSPASRSSNDHAVGRLFLLVRRCLSAGFGV